MRRVVTEAAEGFKPYMMNRGSRFHFDDKPFLAAILFAEEGCLVQAVPPLLMAGAADQFVEGV